MFARLVCALSGITAIALALTVTPDLVARTLSPDGQLNSSTAAVIEALRGLSGLFAIGLLTVAFLKRWAEFAVRTIVEAHVHVWPWTALAAGIGVALIGVGLAISAATGTHIEYLLRDPNAIAELPFYYGALEYVGILLMAGTAGVALFSSTLARGRPARLLVLGGLLTLWLACDDLYMLHEQSSHVLLNERIVFGIYGALALAFVVTNLRYFFETPFVLLLAAGAFLAFGIALDTFAGLARHLPHGLEEMLELIGICFWSAYFVKCSRDTLRHRVACGITGPAPG
jgi:hypothetical protein